ncbi:MAG: tetratricopeptide repeat protein [Cyanobacteria bacterium SZAS LIN-3]|nr:tetratricopeptide repeat protein [Cyanobacteria bacterium SZAS LIN-3]MBS2010739.1 tetratricopeptide repeat protein [Cyanobacteria bacterium SZAS TMP-1]
MNNRWQELKNAAEKAQSEGEYSLAERLWYEVLHESVGMAPTDRRRALALERLGECLWYQEKFFEALPLAEELVSIYTEVFGLGNIETASMQANLGLLHVVLRNLATAEPLLCDALDVKRRVLGANHPALRRLEDTYRDVVGRLKSDESPAGIVSARQWSKTGRFEPVDEIVAGQSTPAYLTAEDALRLWLPVFEEAKQASNSGDWQLAESKLAQGVKLAEHFGENDERLLVTLEGLADMLDKQDKHHQAQPVLERIRQIKIVNFGRLSPIVAEANNNLARCHYYAGSYDAAESAAFECHQIYEKLYGAEHLSVATSLANIGMLYHMQGRFSDAEQAYKRGVDIRTKRQGANHPDTLKLLQNYANLLRDLKRDEEANHLQALATGFMSGSWKAVTIDTDDRLTLQGEICKQCGENLNDQGLCTTCAIVR